MADFPVVPNLPGVPSILRDPNAVAATALSFLSADTVRPQRSGIRWGVFLNGAAVVTPDNFVGIDFRQGWAVADYPVENGGFESYDKVDLPYDARVRFSSGGSLENRIKLLRQVTAIAETLEFYDVVTPEVIYKSCNVQHYDYRRTSRNGVGLITVEMWLLEIRVAPVRGANVQFPSSSSQVNNGTVQPQDPSNEQSSKAEDVK